MSIGSRLAHAWNAFLNRDPHSHMRAFSDTGASYGGRPDRPRLTIANERSIISSIYTRLSVDIAQISIRHVRHDDQGRYKEDIDSGLNECLTVEANVDQTGRALLQDIALTMFDKGVIAVVPVDTTLNPQLSGGWDVNSLRVGHIVQWLPRKVKVNLYNDQTGKREEVTLPKSMVAIVENPFYSVMNEPNSTLQRLIRKLGLLDNIDEVSASGKLDLIVQLPYVVKTEAKRQQAEQRRKDIEFQLKGSTYGIAYTDGSEKITQLNRSVDNNLLKQVEYLHELLFSQLGLTAEVMSGTAEEAAMLNYLNRTIEPIVAAIADEMKRKFLTKTARTQGQSIDYFRDLFKLVPMADLAEMADKFTRNEIVSSNEFRQFIGLKPSADPKADQLRNSNMPQSELGAGEPEEDDDTVVQDAFAGINETLDKIFNDLEAVG